MYFFLLKKKKGAKKENYTKKLLEQAFCRLHSNSIFIFATFSFGSFLF